MITVSKLRLGAMDSPATGLQFHGKSPIVIASRWLPGPAGHWVPAAGRPGPGPLPRPGPAAALQFKMDKLSARLGV